MIILKFLEMCIVATSCFYLGILFPEFVLTLAMEAGINITNPFIGIFLLIWLFYWSLALTNGWCEILDRE